MTHDWLLVETLGAEPAVVAQGRSTKNLVPISAFLRRDPNLMAIQTAIGETVRAGQPLSSITPKHDRVIRTEVVQMTDGRIHGVHIWTGPPDIEPPERLIPGPLKWDLTNNIATDTPESLRNGGENPPDVAVAGRPFTESLPTRDLKPLEELVLSAAIKPVPGRSFCSAWDVTDYRGDSIAVGVVVRVLEEEDDGGGPDLLICRGMNWPSEHDEYTLNAADLEVPSSLGCPEPGEHRALVDLRTWKLLTWVDDPCPFYDWQYDEGGESFSHPDDTAALAAMAADFESGVPAEQVLRLRGVDGGWTPIHVTAQVVETDNGKHIGMLTMRLPTDEERALVPEDATTRRTLSPRKLLSRKAKSTT